ncbi:SDR family NAD(P)-dependent oxidoreductase [Solirhodobacter olei]|uniref:SDR family NAD(P)-dependent oxidoreductase n=1 Tax=Solirhodobacter olei TaxID=2493082 RepID=UPI000FDAE2B2|nr:SDR family NAD(P)-dependent oxidoreductase [Solirhodobacter olei]
MAHPLALIVGAGSGLSAALARSFHREGYAVALAARDTAKLATLAAEVDAACHACDAADPAAVTALFAALGRAPRVVVYNPSARVRGPIAGLDPAEVRRALDTTAFGAFLVGQAAARAMLATAPEGGTRGTILFTGASAGVKGFPQSASFAMGKFAQRGLAQSMSRELHPQGIHVAWINIDGGIRNPGRVEPPDAPDSMLDPEAIAQTYVALVNQHRSAWSEEIAVRPWVEKF